VPVFEAHGDAERPEALMLGALDWYDGIVQKSEIPPPLASFVPWFELEN
jgi:hypothetical protein